MGFQWVDTDATPPTPVVSKGTNAIFASTKYDGVDAIPWHTAPVVVLKRIQFIQNAIIAVTLLGWQKLMTKVKRRKKKTFLNGRNTIQNGW